MSKTINKIKTINVYLVVAVLVIANLVFLPKVLATSYLTKSQILFTNMNSGGASSLIISFKTSGSNTGTTLSVALSGWTGTAGTGTVATTQTPATTFGGTDCEAITGATAHLPGTPAASGTAGTGTITFSGLTAMSANTQYCVVLTSAVTANPTTPDPGTATITAGSDAASSVVFDIISNDQVVVTATVPPSFTFALNSNTDALGTLSSGTVSGTTGVTATVNTNAKNGWFLWGSDANTGLTSATQSYTITSQTPGTNATLSAGTEGYLTGLPAGGITQGSGAGITSAATPYASSGTGNGSGLDTTLRQLASSTGTANGAVVTVKEYAAISATTPAATDYSDTVTLVGAGSF